MYLRIEGVSEFLNENLNMRVATILSGTGVNCTVYDIDYTRRIGSYKEGHSRPILVRFIKEAKRNAILYNRALINRNKTSNFIWISDDVSDVTRRHRKSVRDIAALANKNGTQNIRVHGDGLILDNIKYRHNELDLLPPAFSIEKAKTRESETDVFFQSEFSPFSNFYHSNFSEENGVIYYSAEQAFQSKKARFHGKLQLANKIMCERNPYDIKKMSKDIPTSKEWVDKEHEVMLNILRNKYQQNPGLATTLVNTGQRKLHEATGDRKWAIGAELASKSLLNSDWNGQDMMGKLLESVRSELLDKQPNLLTQSDQTKTPTPDSHALDIDNITPLPDDVLPPPTPLHSDQTGNNNTSTPVSTTRPQGSLRRDAPDSYYNTGARPKTAAVGTHFSFGTANTSQDYSVTSPTAPPRRSTRAKTDVVPFQISQNSQHSRILNY